MASANRRTPNPYYRCELHCNHNLGRGMSISELFDVDEPEPAHRPGRPPSRSAARTRLLPAGALGSTGS